MPRAMRPTMFNATAKTLPRNDGRPEIFSCEGNNCLSKNLPVKSVAIFFPKSQLSIPLCHQYGACRRNASPIGAAEGTVWSEGARTFFEFLN